MPEILLYSKSLNDVPAPTISSGSVDYVMSTDWDNHVSSSAQGYYTVDSGSFIDSGNYVLRYSDTVYKGGTLSGKFLRDTGGSYNVVCNILRLTSESSSIILSINAGYTGDYSDIVNQDTLTIPKNCLLYISRANVPYIYETKKLQLTNTSIIVKVYDSDTGSYYKSYSYPDSTNSTSNTMSYKITGYDYIAKPYLNSDSNWYSFIPWFIDSSAFRICIAVVDGTSTIVSGYPKSYLNNGAEVLNQLEVPRLGISYSNVATYPHRKSTSNYFIRDSKLEFNAVKSESTNANFETVPIVSNYLDNDEAPTGRLLKRGSLVRLNNKASITGGTLYKASDNSIRNNSTIIVPTIVNTNWVILEMQGGGGGGSINYPEIRNNHYLLSGGNSGNYLLIVIPMEYNGLKISYNISIGAGGTSTSSRESIGGDGGDTSILRTTDNIGLYQIICYGGYSGRGSSVDVTNRSTYISSPQVNNYYIIHDSLGSHGSKTKVDISNIYGSLTLSPHTGGSSKEIYDHLKHFDDRYNIVNQGGASYYADGGSYNTGYNPNDSNNGKLGSGGGSGYVNAHGKGGWSGYHHTYDTYGSGSGGAGFINLYY